MEQSAFDRSLAFVELPDVLASKPTTIQTIDPLLGHTGTWILRMAKHPDEGWRLYLQRMDMSGGEPIALVLPDRVCEAIARQRRSLIDRSRRKAKPPMSREECARHRLSEARKILRESRTR